MLKLKLQYFGHLMWRTDLLEKSQMLGMVEGRRRRGRQRMRWLDGNTDSMEMSWVNSGSWWWTRKPGVLQAIGPQSWTWLSNGTELTWTAQIVKNLLAMQETRVWSLGQEDSLENGMAAHCFLWMYSYLENSMDRGAWQAAVHGVTVSQTQLSNSQFHFSYTSDN